MLFSKLRVVALAAALWAGPALSFHPGAQIVVGFGNPVTIGRMDPIIAPGKVSGHVHQVIGGNAFSVSMTDTQALDDATCTTSLAKNDKSNYWFPELFWQAANKTVIPVRSTEYNVYYSFEQTDDEMVAFKPGLRMLVGDPFKRSQPAQATGYNIDPARGAIQPVEIICTGTSYNGVGFPADPTICTGYGGGIRYDVYFPSCYNPAAGLDNYATNMNYSASGGSASAGSKNCPEGYLHHPQIHLEVYWDIQAFFPYWETGSQLLLAQGDPTGLGLHGDFIAGWDTATLNDLIANCHTGNPDDRVDKCNPIGGVNNDNEMNACSLASPVDEPIWGLLPALPGCNPVQSGPAEATQQTGCGATTTLGTPGTQFSDMTSKGWAYNGCYNDNYNGRALSGASQNAYTADIVPMNVDICMAYCDTQGFTYAGLENGGECWCGNSINTAGGDIGPSGLCTLPCVFDPTQVCGGSPYISIYQKCAAGASCVNHGTVAGGPGSVGGGSSSPTSTSTSTPPTSTVSSPATSSSSAAAAPTSTSSTSETGAKPTPAPPPAPSSSSSSASTSTSTTVSSTATPTVADERVTPTSSTPASTSSAAAGTGDGGDDGDEDDDSCDAPVSQRRAVEFRA